MTKEQNSFSKYLVIFIDILGSQNRTNFCEIYQINKIFHEELEKNQQNDSSHTVYHRKIYTFSDCAYIFYGFKDGIEDERQDLGNLFKVALCNCEPIFLKFISEKIIFRGGICYGDAYIDKNRSMFFGNAINEAYRLESKTAIHPRIVVDSFVAEKIEESILTVKCKIAGRDPQYAPCIAMGLMPQMPETGDGIIEKDIDGQYIFNYLHFPENNITSSSIYLPPQDFLEALIQYCNEQIEKNVDYKIIDKYYYLLRFTQSKLENLVEYYTN